MKFGVAILAAGASSRMGRPKLLLPWQGGTVLAHLVTVWRELGATQMAVVVAPSVPSPKPEGQSPNVLVAELDRLGVHDRIENPHPDRGMFSSIRCAAQWNGWQPALTHVLVTLGDQPHVQPVTFRALLDFAEQQPDRICQPSRNGRPRHPVLMPRAVFRELATAPTDSLKQFLVARESGRATFESDDDALDFDLDEPADYERALRHAAAS